jgi:hypothetical protein
LYTLLLARRRLSRAWGARREAVRGSEELSKLEKSKKERGEETRAKGRTKSLTEFMKEGKGTLRENSSFLKSFYIYVLV